MFNAMCGVACRSRSGLGRRVRARLGGISGSLSPFGPGSMVAHMGRGRGARISDFFMRMFRLSGGVSSRARKTFSVAITPLMGT